MNQKLFSQTIRSIRRKIRTAKKYLIKAESHFTACRSWEEKEHLAQLLQGVIYQQPLQRSLLEVYDWKTEKLIKIPLDSTLSAEDEIKKRFKEVRKLKKGLSFAQIEHERAEKELERWNLVLKQAESIKTEETLEEFRNGIGFSTQSKAKKEADETPRRYKQYLSTKNIPILVGKNAHGNEDLTFKLARGNDLWLHVADYSGSHVIIQPKSSQIIDETTLYEAMQLALYHSQARNLKEGEIVYTFVKYVKKIGKLKGKVQIANEKRKKIYLEPKLIATLLPL